MRLPRRCWDGHWRNIWVGLIMPILPMVVVVLPLKKKRRGEVVGMHSLVRGRWAPPGSKVAVAITLIITRDAMIIIRDAMIIIQDVMAEILVVGEEDAVVVAVAGVHHHHRVEIMITDHGHSTQLPLIV